MLRGHVIGVEREPDSKTWRSRSTGGLETRRSKLWFPNVNLRLLPFTTL